MGKSKYYLGLDVGGTNLVAGVIDEGYHIVSKTRMKTRADRSIDEITADMASVSEAAIAEAGLSYDDFSSWGIGMPSCVNPANNLLVHANCFGWKNVPIYDYLKHRMPLPVYIANDANCAAYGEALAGGARDYTDAIMLTLGTGVGGGIILGKKIYPGSDNMGAELGHTKLVFDGELCTCGQRGCLEAYCSSTALIRDTRRALAGRHDSLIWTLCEQDEARVDGEMVFSAAKAGDPLGVELIDRYIRYLAGGISSFITIFRPQVIILGGGLANAGDFLITPLNERLRESTFAAAEIGLPPVVRAELGDDAGLIGAAFLERTMSKN